MVSSKTTNVAQQTLQSAGNYCIFMLCITSHHIVDNWGYRRVNVANVLVDVCVCVCVAHCRTATHRSAVARDRRVAEASRTAAGADLSVTARPSDGAHCVVARRSRTGGSRQQSPHFIVAVINYAAVLTSEIPRVKQLINVLRAPISVSCGFDSYQC